jgi:hypothetical protein
MTMDGLADRIVRLTYLCSEIQKATDSHPVATERLREIIQEAEDLCCALRGEIKRREAN